MGDNRSSSCDSRQWGGRAAREHPRQGLRDLLASPADLVPLAFCGRSATVGRLLPHEHDDREPRAAQSAHGPPELQGGRHRARALQGHRGQPPARPGLRGHRASSARAPASARRSPSASSRSASASSARSRSTRRRSRSSRWSRSATCGARSSTTCAREWGRRRASASSDRASDYPRPRGSFQRPAPPRIRSSTRRALRRGRGRGGARIARRPARRRRRPLRLRDASRPLRPPLSLLNDSKQVAPEDREQLFGAVTACAHPDQRPCLLGAGDRPQRAPSLESRRAARGPPRPPSAGRRMPRRRLPPRADRAAAQSRRRRRHKERRHRGGLDRREGAPRPRDATARLALSPLRVHVPRRLHHARAHGGCPRLRPVRPPPTLLRRALLLEPASSCRRPRSATAVARQDAA